MKQWKLNLIHDLISTKGTTNVSFTHIPKTAGSFVNKLISDNKLNIKLIEHKLDYDTKNIRFCIIRDPVDRFRSHLNYRLRLNDKGMLCESEPRGDWPRELVYAHHNKKIKLNEIVKKMSDNQMVSFIPEKTYEYWLSNIDIALTIDELPEYLALIGYKNIKISDPINVSKPYRGNFNDESVEKVSRVFSKDIELYNWWTRDDTISDNQE